MLKYWIILLFCTRILWEISCGEEHGHGNVGRNQIFEEIYEHLETTSQTIDGHTLITTKDFKKLFEDLNFENCSTENIPSNCHLCYTVSDFLKWQNISSKVNFTEDEFRELSPSIIFLLSAEENVNKSHGCKTFIAGSLNQSKNVFENFQHKYGSNDILNEESVEKILDEINGTVGEKLTNKECFSVHDVIKGANIISEDNISEHDFEYVTGFILLKLLDKHCITEEHDNHNHDHDKKNSTMVVLLPKSEFFIGEIFEEFANDIEMTHEDFKKFYEKLKLGNRNNTATETHVTTDNHAGHDGHENHRRKRRAADDDHGHHDDNDNETDHDKFKKCYNAEEILKIYSVPEGGRINKTKFLQICPSMLQQLESGVCNKNVAHTDGSGSSKEEEAWKPWVATMISILIISLASLTGVLTAPVTQKKWFPFLILALIALAVSVLIGDAILHLLPHALDLHKHEEGGHNHAHGDEGNPILKKESYIWKSLMFLVGIYLFFMFEIIMHSCGSSHAHSHNADTHLIRTSSNQGTNAKGTLQMTEQGTVIHFNPNRKDSVVKSPAGLHTCEDEKSAIEMSISSNGQSCQGLPTSESKNQKKKLTMKQFKSVAWLILVGDAIHNFLDGVAIGAAFSEKWPSGYQGGISTSIAIFCHELPHELGDFAVLLSSGLSIKQALLMNFISSLTAILGGIVGVAIGTQWSASPWIFALTAGLFIYVALVDMLPEILHSGMLKSKPAMCIIITNVGMFIGFLIMFLLAAWEEDIKAVLKD